jgi:cytidine deaminase
MTNFDDHQLIDEARKAAQLAYCPYSKFRVGAAISTDVGIVSAANVENASFGLALCAERSALAKALSMGATKITALALTCPDAQTHMPVDARMPCGACRQWISELAPDARIIVDGVSGTFSAHSLLPHAFMLEKRET